MTLICCYLNDLSADLRRGLDGGQLSPPGAGACDTSRPGDVWQTGTALHRAAGRTPCHGKLFHFQRRPPPGGARHQGVV